MNPAEPRAILVVTDCVGAAWRDPRGAGLLGYWARAHHVSVVQMFRSGFEHCCARRSVSAIRRRNHGGNSRSMFATGMSANGSLLPDVYRERPSPKTASRPRS